MRKEVYKEMKITKRETPLFANNAAFICCSSGTESVFTLHEWFSQGHSATADTYCFYFFHGHKKGIKNTIPEYLSFKRLMSLFPEVEYDVVLLDVSHISRWIQFYMLFAAQYAVNSLTGNHTIRDKNGEPESPIYQKTWILTGQSLEEREADDNTRPGAIRNYIKQLSQGKTEVWNPSSEYYKHEAIKKLPENLRQAIWTCHTPINKGGHYVGCEKCVKCIELQKAYEKAGVPYVPQYIRNEGHDNYIKAAMLLTE